MTIVSSEAPTYALVLGTSPGKPRRLHAANPYDAFAPVCGAYYTTAQTIAIAGGLHVGPLSCKDCLTLAPSNYVKKS